MGPALITRLARTPPVTAVPGPLAAVLYLSAAGAALALAGPREDRVLVALVVLSLAAGVAVASWRWVVLPVCFFAVLELTPWAYSFDELAAVVAAGAIVVGLVVRRGVGVPDELQASDAVVRRLQTPAASGLLRRVASRRALDERIDLLRLRLDAFPHGRYQPIDALPGHVKRADGSVSRWRAMRPLVDRLDVATAVDIGANEGYFSLQLGSLGVTTVALEAAPTNYRTALLAVKRTGLDNVGVLAFEVRADTVEMTPAADCTVFLSLWHHLVRNQGLETATAITARLWEKTARVMFFDTGEDEMPDSFELPAMTPDPRTWLEGYLTATCPGSRVEHLGRHAAFDAEGNPCERNLFAVVRTAPASR
jgi:hypothetical protein